MTRRSYALFGVTTQKFRRGIDDRVPPRWLRVARVSDLRYRARQSRGHADHVTLIMYCGVDENWCRVMTTEYQKQTGVAIELAMTGLSLLSPAPP